MKTKFFFASIVVGAMSAASAQTVVVSAGGEAAGGGYAISYSVGQVATAFASSDAFTLSEGVQQSVAVEVQRIEVVDALPEVKVYPNPTTALVTLRRERAEEATSVTLFDNMGRTLETVAWEGESLSVDLTARPSGVYVVRVAYANNRVKNYKIMKK